MKNILCLDQATTFGWAFYGYIFKYLPETENNDTTNIEETLDEFTIVIKQIWERVKNIEKHLSK